ncbi:hypothetical protein V7S43_017342 [Phytophthora oleae]|uniref:BZIP domain-containing protein n=1 Tax=Phytophthora oleae TaxID=2107226 RepID=A0ABD3EUW1_9STRA
MGDQAMMEEVLELLAVDSPDQTSAESAAVSSASGSNHTSLVSELNHGSASSNNYGDSGDDAASTSGTQGRKDDSLEEKYPADYRTVQFQGADAALQQNSMSNSLAPVAQRTAPPGLQSPWAPPTMHHSPPFFAVNPPPASAKLPMPVQVATSAAIPIPPEASIGPQTPRHRSLRVSPPKKPRPSPSTTTSNVLPTGQRVKVMNSAEFDERRRKLRMQTASRRYRKRKKEESRQQKSKILELQAELTRLQDLETQTKQYQQRTIASLEKELQMHQDEISDLSQKVQNAANEELNWINLMSSHLRK